MLFDTKAFGIRVRQLRKDRNLTQEQLAEILHISISHLGKIEIGYNAPSIDLILSMADFFSVSTDYLLRGQTFTKSEWESAPSGHKLFLAMLVKSILDTGNLP